MSRRHSAVALTSRPNKTAVAIVKHKQLPLVDDISTVDHLVMSDHAIERCQERGIGIMEIYSTIAAPEHTISSRAGDDTRTYLRGDLQVVVGHDRNTIITVIDRDEDFRDEPRNPLNPLIPKRKADSPMPSKAAGNTQTLDEAWVLVPHDTPEIRAIDITPALADKMLSTMDINRPVRRTRVDYYLEQIAAKTLLTTHQAVAMNVKGKLQDGQHRLTAIYESGETVRMFVGVGFAEENFAVIDTGAVRSYGDVLHLEGYGDHNHLGSVARLVYLYLNLDFTSTHRVDNPMIISIVAADPEGFENAIWAGKELAKAVFLPKTAGAAAYYLIRRVNADAVTDKFFEPLLSGGVGLDSIEDPRIRLTRLLARGHKDRTRRSSPEYLALVIKCWNAWIEGRVVETLTWRRGEAMPVVTKSTRKR